MFVVPASVFSVLIHACCVGYNDIVCSMVLITMFVLGKHDTMQVFIQ